MTFLHFLRVHVHMYYMYVHMYQVRKATCTTLHNIKC